MKTKIITLILALVAIATAQAQTYTITLDCGEGGSIGVSKQSGMFIENATEASEGQTVLVSVRIYNKIYRLSELYYTTESGTKVDINTLNHFTSTGYDKTYCFTMPAENVTIVARFAQPDYIATIQSVGESLPVFEVAFPGIANFSGAMSYGMGLVARKTGANEGETLTIKLSASNMMHYAVAFEGIVCVGESGTEIPVTKVSDDTYTFVMPAENVTVTETCRALMPRLGELTVSGGTLMPDFNTGTTDYRVTVKHSVSRIGLSARSTQLTIVEDEWMAKTLTYQRDGNGVILGVSGDIRLDVGDNVIHLTAEFNNGIISGGRKTHYTVTITRLPDAIVLHDNADNANVIDENAGTTKDVVLHSRTFYRDGRWNTLCLPFNVENFEGTPLEGTEVRTLTGASFENHTLTLNWSAPLSAIEAKMPYIMRWKSSGEPLENIFNPLFPNATICEDSSVELLEFDPPGIQFLGFPYPMDYEADYRYMLYMNNDNHFDYPKEDMIINSFHAHFLFTGEISMGTPDDTSDDNGIIRNIVLNFGDETTEIVNYQLSTINSNDSWYSIDGRKLQGEPMQKGIYIHNGKKVIK